MDMAAVAGALNSIKSALGIFKVGRDLLSRGDAAKVDSLVARAEDALGRGNAELAKALGFPLCQCTFPPQIMLWKEKQKAHICPNAECGRTYITLIESVPRSRDRFADF